ncbi:hypothetical protein D3C85_1689100 [compost metagenome]
MYIRIYTCNLGHLLKDTVIVYLVLSRIVQERDDLPLDEQCIADCHDLIIDNVRGVSDLGQHGSGIAVDLLDGASGEEIEEDTGQQADG